MAGGWLDGAAAAAATDFSSFLVLCWGREEKEGSFRVRVRVSKMVLNSTMASLPSRPENTPGGVEEMAA